MSSHVLELVVAKHSWEEVLAEHNEFTLIIGSNGKAEFYSLLVESMVGVKIMREQLFSGN